MRLSISSALTVLLFMSPAVPARVQTDDGSQALRLIAVATEAEAREIRGLLQTGGDFGALARERSVDASAAADGLLGDFALAALNDQFRAALAGVEPGEVTQPVRLGSRFVLLRWGDPPATPWQLAHDRAVEAFSAGDYAEAREYFDQAIAEAESFGPTDLRLARSLTGLAETYRLQGEYGDAQPLYTRVLEIREAVQGPAHAELAPVLNNLGEAYRLAGDPASARSAFDRSLRILEANGADARDLAFVLSNVAEASRELGEPLRAAEALDRSIALLEAGVPADDPALLAALGNRGDVALDAGLYPEATRLYRRVLDARWAGPGGQSLASVFDALGDVARLAYFWDDELDRATARLRESLASAKPSEALYVSMRDLFLDASAIEGAELVMQEAVRAFPASPEARLNLAEVYLRAGTLVQGQEVLGEAASILGSQPADPTLEHQVYLRTGELYRSMGNSRDAILAYRRAEAADPDDGALRIALGDLLLETGQVGEAEAEFRQALERDPELAEAHRGLAEVALRRGAFTEAAGEAQRAVELAPDLLTANYALAMALIRAGETDAGRARLDAYRAEQAARDTATTAKQRVEVQVRSAVRQWAEGAPDEGVAQLRQAMRERDAGPAIAFSWSPDIKLAVLYQKVGDYGAARRALEEALSAGCCDRRSAYLVYRTLWFGADAVGDEGERARFEALYLRDLSAALEAPPS